MFVCPEWEACKFSKSVKGKASYTTMMSMGFWSGVALCLHVFTPLVRVLRIVDCDRKPSICFVYGELEQAKEEIKNSLNNIPKNYEPIIEIIDAKLKNRLDSPLHLMAYLLNQYYNYRNPLIHLEQEISLGVIECLDVLFPGELDMQNKIISEELPMYKERESTFGKALAVKVVTWWSNFGVITPHLQRLAMRIISLTTSSSGCERNWSAFEGVSTYKKRNRLDTNLLNNLVFVQFNARLMSTQKKEKDRSNMEVLLASDSTYAQDWIVDGIDDEEEVGDVMGEDGSPRPRSSRIRELYEDDFESEDEEEK
ncbi:hypothetical protein DH2020_016700 [Rehmannia glutinosa]|uniref:HAT C-terminal dimerisation domain-containing protein n=1 Tax=Rehmannia glutinosa TaxID=99300 RepID=A0ABR0WT04_REHGL